MSPTRVFSPLPLHPEQRHTLDGAQSRYLLRALRLRVGDVITMFDGSDGEYPATIEFINAGRVEVTLGKRRDLSLESALRIRLVQAISKGDRMDTVVQKATELGVAEIHPVISQYSVVKLDRERADRRRMHWQKIAQSACEQCGRNIVPDIAEPRPLLHWFGDHATPSGPRLVLQPGAGRAMLNAPVTGSALTLLIGPEGGFSDTEYAGAAAAGFLAVSLGPRILRTETAAVAAISSAQAAWGDCTARPAGD